LIAIRNNIYKTAPPLTQNSNKKIFSWKNKIRNGKDNGREEVKIPTRPFKFSFQKKAIF
jgi:hypothetical protein